VFTPPHHPSGTDRVFDAYQQFGVAAECIINIQGDEPFVHPAQIDSLIALFKDKKAPQIATLVKPVLNNEELFSPHLPKVVLDSQGYALYFSRHPLPYQRQLEPDQWLTQHPYLRHIGLYAYRPDVLAAITKLPPSSLEQAESLEQLRWLENGYRILTAETELETIGIDTPEDVERAKRHLRHLQSQG
jgi:3-deoxy-manno-octulosonate cytidylyltransferase (CMP-KDO synthetase)